MGDWLRELADARVTTADLGPCRETTNRRAAVGQAMRVRGEVEAFERRWPNPQDCDPVVPTFTWSQLERQLADLAVCAFYGLRQRVVNSSANQDRKF